MKKLLMLLALSTLAACAHHRDVRPGADGNHKVMLKTEDKDEGYREAMSQAEHYCKEKNQSPVIVDEKSSYTGTMKEESYRQGKTISKVAQMAGGAGYVFGGQRESQAGGIIGLGGGIANSALGQGYSYVMNFKCQ